MFPRHTLVRRASRNIAVSKHVERRLAVPRSSVVQHGIDEGSPSAATFNDVHKKICFAFVGRFVQEKGLSVFVDALALLAQQGREFDARLIGDGRERSKIETQITAAKLNSRVKIMGYLSGKAFAEAVAHVSVVVMPSVWEETAGLAAIEQMMRGRLVICSDIGGLSEIVGEAGMKFPAGDAGALAACLNKIIETPLLIEEFGSKARARAQSLFSRAQMLKGHAAIYQGLRE